ncbi:MAG: hypothetical protein V1743_00360 [Nanoarchaeota archaeon]
MDAIDNTTLDALVQELADVVKSNGELVMFSDKDHGDGSGSDSWESSFVMRTYSLEKNSVKATYTEAQSYSNAGDWVLEITEQNDSGLEITRDGKPVLSGERLLSYYHKVQVRGQEAEITTKDTQPWKINTTAALDELQKYVRELHSG